MEGGKLSRGGPRSSRGGRAGGGVLARGKGKGAGNARAAGAEFGDEFGRDRSTGLAMKLRLAVESRLAEGPGRSGTQRLEKEKAKKKEEEETALFMLFSAPFPPQFDCSSHAHSSTRETAPSSHHQAPPTLSSDTKRLSLTRDSAPLIKWNGLCCLDEPGNSRVSINYWGTMTLDDGRPPGVSEDEFKTVYAVQSSRTRNLPDSGLYDSFDCNNHLQNLEEW